MSVYKPKNSPYWHFDFQLSGVRFHGSTGTTVKGKARIIEAQRRNEAASGEGNRKRRPMTLDAAAGRYFVEIAEHQPSAGTTEYQLAKLIEALGKDVERVEIEALVIRSASKEDPWFGRRMVQLLFRIGRDYRSKPHVVVDLTNNAVLVETEGELK